ncbi:porin [Cupriavidus necator]
MKKVSVVLAALSAASGAANAQSVTLYGVVDTPVEFATNVASGAPTINTATGEITQRPGGNRFALVSSGGLSGSRWGMRGTESLGNGLNAVFTLESGFGADEGRSSQGGRLFGRQAWVGLQHGTYGTLSFGRQYAAIYDAFSNFTPMGYAPLYEPSTYLLGGFRQDNTIKYAGKFGPLSAYAHYSFGTGQGTLGVVPLAAGGSGESPGNFGDNTAYGATLIYASGPFGVTATYDQWNPAVTAGNRGRAKKAGAAVSYKIGPAKLIAGYRWADTQSSSGNTLLRDDMYWVGANYDVTSALVLKLGYYYDNLKVLRVGTAAAATNPANPWQVSFLADYSFSKRTDVYLTMAYAKNSGLNFDSSPTGFSSGYFLAQGRNNQFGTAIGIRHRF